ncbi:hypothetical protein [Pacificibacter sp. AS14]|uniref:hypothetical protein n=1 Tax=Pacificibacter sp. AS14 TaxID=3135785 RepID=UPI0031710EEC
MGKQYDHAALKKLITPLRGFKSLSLAKAALRGIEAIRTNKHGHVHGKPPAVTGEIRFVESLFNLVASSQPPPREISR